MRPHSPYETLKKRLECVYFSRRRFWLKWQVSKSPSSKIFKLKCLWKSPSIFRLSIRLKNLKKIRKMFLPFVGGPFLRDMNINLNSIISTNWPCLPLWRVAWFWREDQLERYSWKYSSGIDWNRPTRPNGTQGQLVHISQNFLSSVVTVPRYLKAMGEWVAVKSWDITSAFENCIRRKPQEDTSPLRCIIFRVINDVVFNNDINIS